MKTDKTSYNIVLCRKVNNKCISSVIKRSNISTFSELDGDGKFNLHQNQSQPEAGIHCRTRDNCSITAGLDNDIDQGEMTCDKKGYTISLCALSSDFPLLGFGNKEVGREVESPHSGTPLLPEISAPDPFIISKSRQLNRRVTLNVGGVRHEVMWAMLEQVPRSRLGKLATAGTHEQVLGTPGAAVSLSFSPRF